MQIETQRYLKCIADAEVWLDAHQVPLSQTPAYAALRAQLEAQELAIESAATAQGQSGGGASQGVVVKSALLGAMRHDIETVARGARAVALTQPGFENSFALPTSWGEESTAGAARLFAANLGIPANRDALTNLGMNANTASELIADSAQYEQLFRDKAGATQARIEDGTDLDEAIRASSNTIDTLDAIVHFVYADDKNALISWKEAKRLEKMRAHRASPTPTPPAS